MTILGTIVFLYTAAATATAVMILCALRLSSRRAEPDLIRFCGWCKRVHLDGRWQSIPLHSLVPPGQLAEHVTGAQCPECHATFLKSLV